MRAVISLLVVLFCMDGAQTQPGTQTDVQAESQRTATAAAAAEVCTQYPDIYAELKELRFMVVELRTTLKYTQDDLKVLEAEHVAVKERLAVSETKVETLERGLQDTKTQMKTEMDDLKKENAAHEAELTRVRSRLAAAETEVENLKKANEATVADVKDLKIKHSTQDQEMGSLKTRLVASETEIGNLKTGNTAQGAELMELKSRLAAAETDLENLEKGIKTAPKVAFSAGLSNSLFIDSGSNDLNLVFTKVITNVGQAYSSTTGFFTAPVRGVYYFRFTVMDVLNSRAMSVRMHKNGKQLIWLWQYGADGQNNYQSSGLTLQLEERDVVNMVLPKGFRLWDNVDNRCTFSGFLLFPL